MNEVNGPSFLEFLFLTIVFLSLIGLGVIAGQGIVVSRICKAKGYDKSYPIGTSWVCAQDAPNGEVIYLLDLID